jgi:hypothetical protein
MEGKTVMDIAYKLAQYLANAGFGTLNTDIFVGQLPENTNGVWVERIGGQLNNYVPIEESALNIYASNTSSQAAVEQLEGIKRFIHRMHSTSSTGVFMYTILVIGDVEEVSRDLEYNKIYKLTVQLVYRATSLIS